MNDRAGKREAGAMPFYAPPRRKTSAEIISEARAAVYGEMSSASAGNSPNAQALRPLRTRRPFTPRDPQRTLFADRERRREARPPSAFNLKFLNLSEGGDDGYGVGVATRVSTFDEGVLLTEPQNYGRKKTTLRPHTRIPEKPSDIFSGLPKLPHLNGRSKPLHRRNTTGNDESKSETDLTQVVSIIRPFGAFDIESEAHHEGSSGEKKAPRPHSSSKRKYPASSKSSPEGKSGVLCDINVRHLDVEMPNLVHWENFDNFSLLELAEALSQKIREPDKALQLMDALQKLVEQNQPANSLRDLTLRSLYTYIDSEDERVLVAIARAMLALRVTGAHLAAACKLVFKVARNDKNDHFFRTTNLLELLVEGCGRADPITEGECCIYGAGALRFLSLEPRLRALAHRAGALHLAALHLKILNNAKAESPRAVSEQSAHALYQLTGALRNLAGGAAGGREPRAFVGSGALAELLAALRLHHTDRDVLTNVVRCLSVLSADESCCAWLCASTSSARALLTALAECASRAPLAVRLAYTLGNMAAADEHARINIYNEENGIDVLLTILESYTDRNDRETRDPDTDPDLHLVGSDLGGCGNPSINEDVLIKTVRVVANLCLAEKVGRGLAETHAERTVKALLACLEMADRTWRDTAAITDLEGDTETGEERRQELATAALATLNNVTFYRDPPDAPDPLDTLLEKLCQVTCRWLSGTGAAACEAVRALGNLTRCPRLAQLLVLAGTLQELIPALQHEEASVRCAAAGVLVNVCGAGCGEEAADVATRALTAAADAGDAASAALLTRALWNAHTHRPLSDHAAFTATAALDIFIDDESVFAACEALRSSDRRASDPELSKHHVKFEQDNNNFPQPSERKPFVKSSSVDQELHLSGDEEAGYSGEDLGFEEGDLYTEYGCECAPCRRLAAWEELVGVAMPLLEKLRPPRADASVGTE